MSDIDENTVRKIARLARIHLEEKEVAPYTKELSNIMDWVAQLGELDTENVEPMTSVSDIQPSLRKDEINDGNQVEDVLVNAPESDHGFFLVPKVVE